MCYFIVSGCFTADSAEKLSSEKCFYLLEISYLLNQTSWNVYKKLIFTTILGGKKSQLNRSELSTARMTITWLLYFVWRGTFKCKYVGYVGIYFECCHVIPSLHLAFPSFLRLFFSLSNLLSVANSSNNTFTISYVVRPAWQSSSLYCWNCQSSTARGRQRGLKGHLGRSEDRLCRHVLVCAL